LHFGPLPRTSFYSAAPLRIEAQTSLCDSVKRLWNGVWNCNPTSLPFAIKGSCCVKTATAIARATMRRPQGSILCWLLPGPYKAEKALVCRAPQLCAGCRQISLAGLSTATIFDGFDAAMCKIPPDAAKPKFRPWAEHFLNFSARARAGEESAQILFRVIPSRRRGNCWRRSGRVRFQ